MIKTHCLQSHLKFVATPPTNLEFNDTSISISKAIQTKSSVAAHHHVSKLEKKPN